jgi:predicted nucleic acid-binding protein
MGPLSTLFDSVILIDYLRNIPAAAAELSRYSRRERAISIVTWMEVMAGAAVGSKAATRLFLEDFGLIKLSDEIAERTVRVRQQARLKLPDAIIFATAQEHGLLFVTRNTKDFDASAPGIRVPYIF